VTESKFFARLNSIPVVVLKFEHDFPHVSICHLIVSVTVRNVCQDIVLNTLDISLTLEESDCYLIALSILCFEMTR
jgi:hypothetical protein